MLRYFARSCPQDNSIAGLALQVTLSLVDTRDFFPMTVRVMATFFGEQ
jgi:hypothetical protein